MGGRKWLLPCSVGLSAINGLLSLVPFVLLWLVVRTLLTAEGSLADAPVWDYALAAFIVSVANVLLYFAALMFSHLAAFRIETNMRRKAMQRLMRVPLGFFDTQNTGRMRKIIDHQMKVGMEYLRLMKERYPHINTNISPFLIHLTSSAWTTLFCELVEHEEYSEEEVKQALMQYITFGTAGWKELMKP